jgi:hypothetical protein
MYDKWQAQKWWGDNNERIMELYNVRRFSRHAAALRRRRGQSLPLPVPAFCMHVSSVSFTCMSHPMV